LESLISSIETELRDGGVSEVSAEDLGLMVLQRLLDLDKVAYVRFASVYRDFKDLDEFNDELRRLTQ
jgi:transcriptional repressor NrdR